MPIIGIEKSLITKKVKAKEIQTKAKSKTILTGVAEFLPNEFLERDIICFLVNLKLNTLGFKSYVPLSFLTCLIYNAVNCAISTLSDSTYEFFCLNW